MVRHRVAAGTLAGRTLASMYLGDSVGAKCNPDNYHEFLVPPDSDGDRDSEGEPLPGRVLVGVHGGGDDGVSGGTMTTLTPIVSSSA